MKKQTVLAFISGFLLFGSIQAYGMERPLNENTILAEGGNEYLLIYKEDFIDAMNSNIYLRDTKLSPYFTDKITFQETALDGKQTQCGRSTTGKTNVTIEVAGYGINYGVSDGTIWWTNSTKRKLQEGSKSVYDYYQVINRFNTLPLVGAGSYIEVKFKTQKKSGFAFDIYTVSPQLVSDQITEKSLTSKGYMMRELDFLELTTECNGMSKGYVKPHGSVIISDKDTDRWLYSGEASNPGFEKKMKINGEEWFDEWHVFQAYVEDTYIDVYLDGKKYAHASWKQYGTLPEKCMNLIIGDELVSGAFDSPVKYNNEEVYKSTSCVDYIIIGQKVIK